MGGHTRADGALSRLTSRAALRTLIERRRDLARKAFLFTAALTVNSLGLAQTEPRLSLALAVFTVIAALGAAGYLIALLVSYRDWCLCICAATAAVLAVGTNVFRGPVDMLPHLVQFGFVAAGGAVVAIGLSRKSALDAAVLAQHETLAPEKETT